MPDKYITKLTFNCVSFSWDWKESAPTALIEEALKEAGGGFKAYPIKTGHDHYMCIIAPSEEWADKFQAEWDKAMGTDEPTDPEYIISEQVERGDALTPLDDSQLPF